MDWVSATVRDIDPETLAEQFGSTLDTWVKTRGLMGYSDSLLGNAGLRICYTPGRPAVHLIAPGQWLNHVSMRGQRELLRALTASQAAFTRIDLQLTDERPVATPRDVWDALQRGDVATRTKSWFWNEAGGSKRGSSVYIGAKSSEQRLLVYDKEAESDGEVPGVRWELRTRDEAAESLVPQILAADEWGPVWTGRVLTFIDFRERAVDANSARCPRLAWFEELVQGAEKMRAYPPRAPRMLDDVLRWLDRQLHRRSRSSSKRRAVTSNRSPVSSMTDSHGCARRTGRCWTPNVNAGPEAADGGDAVSCAREQLPPRVLAAIELLRAVRARVLWERAHGEGNHDASDRTSGDVRPGEHPGTGRRP